MRGFNALDGFRAAAVLIVSACIVLGALSLDASIRVMHRADAALDRLEVFEFAFALTTAINAERRPLELALDSEHERSLDSMSDLRSARIRTDIAMARMRHAAAAMPQAGIADLSILEAKLRSERARADDLLALPLRERRVSDLLSIIRGMVLAARTVEPIVARAAREVIDADPDLAGPVNLARLLSALYESAAQLPSEIVPVLEARQVLPPEVRMSALRLQQRILALWDVGGAQLEFGNPSPAFDKARDDIQAHFFGKGFPFLSRAVERYALRAPSGEGSARNLSRVYGPTIQPIAFLRDRYVTDVMAEARADRAEALQRTMISIGLTGLILLIVPVLAWTTYREILRPLLQFRNQIVGICSEGGPVSAQPYQGSVPPVRDLYRALETLQARDGERRALERERLQLAEKLRALSETDDLTGLLNRRGLWRELHPFGSRAVRIGLVVADIDHFKRINDSHGHVEGDRVLQAFSQRLAALVGKDTVAARYGGEEFALALRGRPLEEMLELVETLRADVEAMTLTSKSGRPIRMTSSFGLAYADGPVEDWEALFRQADAALYAAKLSGRNRVRATNDVLAHLADPTGPACADRRRQASGETL